MREIRLSGSEGGGSEINRFSLPLFRVSRHASWPFVAFVVNGS